MKFKKGTWRNIEEQRPTHNGEYDVQLRSGSQHRIDFRAGAWVSESENIVEWRGLELKGVSRAKPARQAMDAYRAASPETHGAALEGALFLARRGVSLNFKADAYHFYLVANAIDRSRLKPVDTEWVERYAVKYRATTEIEQRKADAFFDQRGGRPRIG